MAGSVAPGRRACERQSALAAVRIAGKKEAPGAGARDGRSVTAGRRNRLQRQVCRGGGHVEVVLAVQDARKHALLWIEELAKVIAAEFGTRQFPPVVEAIDIRVAAGGIGDGLLATIGSALAALGQEVHALILDQDDAALIRHRFGEHGPQLRAFESNSHGCDLQGAGKEASRREGGKLLRGQCRTALRLDRHCTRMRLQLPSSISRSSVSPRVSKNTSSTRSISSPSRRSSTA